MQASFPIRVLPGQTLVGRDCGLVRCRGGCGDLGLAKCGVTGAPHHIARLVGCLQRRAQSVVVIIRKAVLPIAVAGLDEQHAGGKWCVRARAVLGGDHRAAAGRDALVGVESDVLPAFCY